MGSSKKTQHRQIHSNEQALLKTVRRVIDAGRDVGVNIVFIKDNFLPEEVPIDKHFKIYGPHCVIGTPDAEVVPELDPKPGDFQIRKKHYSAFNSTRLDAVLRELDVRRLYITGAWTEACVQHTVVDAFYLNYEIIVVRDAVSSPHREAHEYALNYMRQYHRAKIITSDQAIALFKQDPEAVNSNALIPPEGENLSYKEWTLASRK